MTTAFTNTLRARPGTIQLGSETEARLTFRVQILDAWETVRFEAPADMAVRVVKERAVEAVMPAGEDPEEYSVRLAGWEVLDENITLGACGATNGSILLVSGRRRRPVR
jgi:hypothetical protein